MSKKYPETLLEFERWFRTEEDCRDYVVKLRWPDGFRCLRCGHGQAWAGSRRILRCGKCRKDNYVTAGTIFQDSHLPLRLWFRAIWWSTNQKSGVSALGLQRLLGLGSYRTAWSCLHKLRRAMVRPGRELLSGTVEVDEVYVGGLKRDNSSHRAKACVLVAAEVRGKAIGRIRLQRIPDAREPHIVMGVRRTVAPGSKLVTDGAWAYKALIPHGYQHDREVQGDRSRRELDQMRPLPRVHRVASLLKRWLLGTYQGRVSGEKLDHYLEEFSFRFNRRHSEARGMLFYRLVQQCVNIAPVDYAAIIA
jgi:ISXO2-like transposase domain/Transposase zinc-ribbon domain